MVPFCGYMRTGGDANGRIKLSPDFLTDFGGPGASIVMRCLPEGAIGIYPEAVFLQMRKAGGTLEIQQAASSFVARRNLRALNAMSCTATVSPQGRITIPGEFRAFAGLDAEKDFVLTGVEIGVEVWAYSRWKQEQDAMLAFYKEQSETELRRSLERPGGVLGTQEPPAEPK